MVARTPPWRTWGQRDSAGAEPEYHAGMIDPQAAEQLILQALTALPIESLPVAQCVGAVLRENVYAERDQPPFDRVAMDGVALLAASVAGGRREFHVQATQAAGDPALSLLTPQHCIEVMTGAVLPAGCDSVVPVEATHSANALCHIDAATAVRAWGNVHRRGGDCAQGAPLLSTGIVLQAPEIAIAAAAGMARVRVSSPPRIMLISTGNELIEPGEPIAAHQIRRSNVYGVAAALRRRGFERVADEHLPDDPTLLRRRLSAHLDTHDVLILSGGVSAGRFDFVPQVLGEIGVRCVLHGIAQRPGKPMWFGVSSNGRAVFALPGNPVSTMVCLARYVLPALYAAMGAPAPERERVALSAAVNWRPTLSGLLPVRLHGDDWARTWATPAAPNGSGDFSALALSPGCIELPPGPADYVKGFVAPLYRW